SCADVSVGCRRSSRCSARVGVLDERRRRFLELIHHPNCGVEIEQIRVRQLFALQDRISRMRADARVERCLLMRVLAIAKVANLAQIDREAIGESDGGDARESCGVCFYGAERGGDRAVIARGVSERLACKIESEARRWPAG